MMQAPDIRPRSRWRWAPVFMVCIAIGIGGGLLVSWGLWPVQYVDVAPDSLHLAHRQEYILLISQAYAYDRDAAAAQSRLAALGDPQVVGAQVAALAEQYAGEGRRQEHIEALAGLAYALGVQRAALAPYLPVSVPAATWTPRPTATLPPTPTETATAPPTATPTGTPTQTPTRTPAPTATAQMATPDSTSEPAQQITVAPTATPAAPRFVLSQQARSCNRANGLLQVQVYDERGEPLPSIELLARWDAQEERFYTGLKPETNPGYADLAMTKGHTYQLSIVGYDSDVALDITADTCLDAGALASWQIVFRLTNGAAGSQQTPSR